MPSDHSQLLLAPSSASPSKVHLRSIRDLPFPAFCRQTAWKQAAEIFQAEGRRLLQLAHALPKHLLCQRILIEPMPGIRDDSLDWSAGMVLEHLIEAGAACGQIAIELSNGERPWGPLDLAAVRPDGSRGIRVVQDFKDFLTDFAEALSQDAGDQDRTLTFPHPWHGELTAQGWHSLAAFHQRLHRQRMERIVALSGKPKPR
jgi:hypothetical protein